jgi:hypothetical protein
VAIQVLADYVMSVAGDGGGDLLQLCGVTEGRRGRIIRSRCEDAVLVVE